MDALDFFNPLKWVKPDEYVGFWHWVLENVLQGFWAKFFASLFFALALYVGLRRQNFRQAFLFYILAFLLAYGGGMVKFLKNFLLAVNFL